MQISMKQWREEETVKINQCLKYIYYVCDIL